MAKVKVTGYLNISEEQMDPDDATGVTEEAHILIVAGDGPGFPPHIYDLEDIEVEKAY